MSEDKKKIHRIELPDYFIHNGVTYEPGIHKIEDEGVANDLKDAKERYLKEQEKRRLDEESRLQSINVSGKVEIGTGDGVTMDQIQAIVQQAVEVSRAEMQAIIEDQKAQIEELRSSLEEEPEEEPEVTKESGSKAKEEGK